MKIDIILSVIAGMVTTAEQATLNSDSFWSSEQSPGSDSVDSVTWF